MLLFLSLSNKIPSRIDIEPPRPAHGREGIAVVTIVRDEEASISDWIKFHALAGISHFFLYDNGSSDRTVEAAKAVPGVNVEVVPWVMKARLPGTGYMLHQQVLAYAHAIGTFGARFRWMTFIDIDEYLFPATAESLGKVLSALEAFQNVSVPWSMFGTSGQVGPTGLPLVVSYTRRARQPRGALLNFKCIVDPCDVVTVSVHKFWTRRMQADSVNGAGFRAQHRRRRTPEFLAADVIRLNHYCTRSAEEFERKIAKGAVSGMAQNRREAMLRERAAAIAADEIEDLAAIEFLSRRQLISEAISEIRTAR